MDRRCKSWGLICWDNGSVTYGNCTSCFFVNAVKIGCIIGQNFSCNLHYEKFADGSVKCIEEELPFDLPEGWAWERLSNLASFSGGKTPSTSCSEYWNGDTLWVTSKDMKSKYITSSQLRLSALGTEQMQMYQPDTLLLVTRSGILRHTLPVAILKESATINQDLKAIILYMPQLAEYIYVCLRACLISQRVRIGEIDFLPCKAKSRSNPDGLQGFLTQSGRKICRQGGRGEMLNRL